MKKITISDKRLNARHMFKNLFVKKNPKWGHHIYHSLHKIHVCRRHYFNDRLSGRTACIQDSDSTISIPLKTTLQFHIPHCFLESVCAIQEYWSKGQSCFKEQLSLQSDQWTGWAREHGTQAILAILLTVSHLAHHNTLQSLLPGICRMETCLDFFYMKTCKKTI